MPPRLQPLASSFSLCLRPAVKPSTTPNFLPVTQTANLSQREKRRKAKRDPYAWAQAQQRKNANIKRKQEIEKENQGEGWNDPINGKWTPFLESLDSAGQSQQSRLKAGRDGSAVPLPQEEGMRNFFLTDEELQQATEHAYSLTKPMAGVVEQQVDAKFDQELQEHEEKHARAVEAMSRITSMENANAKHKYHANVRRLVDTFGRHKTDQVLKPKPESIGASDEGVKKRAGPDTGSSEVQIAILTAKIRRLSEVLKTNRGYKDKANTRNLELLVHRRQKLLRYMERKERGGERWTFLLQQLGITEAAWKGQVTTLGK